MHKHALVLGKFMPLHLGHLALVHSTRDRALKTTVLLCAEETEIISGDDRERWLRTTFSEDAQITVRRFDYSAADLPATSVSSRGISAQWTARLKPLLPTVDLIVGSEPYVRYVAEYWGIDFHLFDPDRRQVSISATEIRARPYAHRHLLAPAARPDFVQRIVLHGTESTGKSTLTRHLADRYGTPFVPETARDIVAHTDKVVYDDLLAIADRQATAILEGIPQADGVLFIDTDYWTTLAYARFLFDRELPARPEWLAAAANDLCLYCSPDAPFVQDGTRVAVDGRLRLDAFHRRSRLESGVATVEVGGMTWDERFDRADQVVAEYLG